MNDHEILTNSLESWKKQTQAEAIINGNLLMNKDLTNDKEVLGWCHIGLNRQS